MDAQIANSWLAAAETEYAKPADWRGWADKMILTMSDPPEWIINMSLAQNVDQLWKAMADKLESERQVATYLASDDLRIGYIWLRYKRGDISMQDCLRLAGQHADAGNSRLSCESIYEVLNRLEAGEPIVQIESRAKKLLEPLGELAMSQWDYIVKTVQL